MLAFICIKVRGFQIIVQCFSFSIFENVSNFEHLDCSTSLNCSCKRSKSFGLTLFLISNTQRAPLNPETWTTRTFWRLQADYPAGSLKSALPKIDLPPTCRFLLRTSKITGRAGESVQCTNAAVKGRKWKCGARADASDAAFPWKYYLVRRR